MIQYLHQIGYPRVTTGTETTHMVTRMNTFMIKEVTHMEITLHTHKNSGGGSRNRQNRQQDYTYGMQWDQA